MTKSEALHAALIGFIKPIVRQAVREAIQEHNSFAPVKDSPPRTVEQMAARLDCSNSTIYRLIKEGAPHFRQSRRIYFDEAELLSWMREGQK